MTTTAAGRLTPRLGRVFAWALAATALAFVVWMVPVRDRCYDSRSPTSTRVAVTRDGAGCVLHIPSGDVPIPEAECSALVCEPGVLSTFSHARVGVVGALFALYMVGTVIWAGRWRALLSFAGIDVSLGRVWRVSIEAQAGGVLLPGGIGSDALRITSMVARPSRAGETRAPPSVVVASVLLDRSVGVSLIAGLAALCGFVSGELGAGLLAGVLAAIPTGVVAGLIVLRRAPIERIPRLARGRLGRIVQPVLEYVRDPRAPRSIAAAAALSLGVAIVQFAVIRGLVAALGGSPVHERWIYIGTAMAFLVAAIPAVPGGWGTTDATYVLFFGKAGLPASVALGVCLLFRSFWYLLAVAGGLLYAARGPSGIVVPRSDPASGAAGPPLIETGSRPPLGGIQPDSDVDTPAPRPS